MTVPIITLFAEKGGTGKTTLAFNLAGSLSKLGHRVLAVDCDKQGNLSKTFLDEKKVIGLHKLNTVAAVFDETVVANPNQIVYPTKLENVFVVPANRLLKDHIMPNEDVRSKVQWELARFLNDVVVSGKIEFVVIDTSPDIDGLPAWASLLAGGSVMTPIEPSSYSAQSFHGVTMQLQEARKLQPDLNFLGYVINRKDGRHKDHAEWEKAFRNAVGKDVLDTVIRNLSAFGRARDAGLPVMLHDPKSEATKLMKAFTEEVLAKVAPSKPKKKTQSKRKRRAA